MPFKNSIFNVSLRVEGKEYIYNTLSGSCVSKTYYANLFKENQTPLINMQMIVPTDLNEYLKVKVMWQRSVHSVLERNFYIAPTMSCNFKCPYCYAKHEHATMDEGIGNGVVDFISTSAIKAEKVIINWVGGEPLLNIQRIIQINSALRSRLKHAQLQSIVVTNGYYLTKGKANALVRSGVNTFVVTLDGNETSHDQRRILIDGQGTFNTIMSNIKANAENINIIIRINIDDSNINSIANLISKLKDYGLLNRVFVTLVPVQRFDLNNDFTSAFGVSKSTTEKISRIIVSEQRVFWGGPDPVLHCCSGLRINDFAIGPTGDLFACPISIGNMQKSIGSIFSRQPNAEYYSWYTYKTKRIGSEKCNKCAYFPLCVSECQLIAKNTELTTYDCRHLIYNFRADIKNYIRSGKNECFTN